LIEGGADLSAIDNQGKDWNDHWQPAKKIRDILERAVGSTTPSRNPPSDFSQHGGRLTAVCKRVAPRTIQNAASISADALLAQLAKSAGASSADDAWGYWLQDQQHSKRSFIIYLICSMAAAEFWKGCSEGKEVYTALKSTSPFGSTSSDVIVAEALLFFWYSFFTFMRREVATGELTVADQIAVDDGGTTVCHIIQEATGWSIKEVFIARIKEYGEEDTARCVDVFANVLLRSIGKQEIGDPDSHVDGLKLGDNLAIPMITMIHVTALLPGYLKVYQNIIRAFPMD
jgi:hypothetical protein